MSPTRVVVALLLLALLCRIGGASPPSNSIASSLSVHRRLLQNPDLPAQRQPKTETTNTNWGSSSQPESTALNQSSNQQQQQQPEAAPSSAGDQQASYGQGEPSATTPTSADSGEGASAAGRVRGWLRERLASRWGRN